MAEGITLGDPESLLSTSALRTYCDNGRRVLRPLYNELHIAADELEAALRFLPSADPRMGGFDSRVRAKLVSAHLRRSGDAVEAAVSSLVRTFMSYRKHFITEAPSRPRRAFQVDA